MTDTPRGGIRRLGRRLGLRSGLAAAAVLIVVLARGQLLEPETRVTGATGTRPSLFVAELPDKGGQLCQRGVTVPSGTAAVELLVGTYGDRGPRLSVTLRDSATGLVDARAVVQRGWRQGNLVVPLTGVSRGRGGTVCVRSAGGARLAFAGEPAGLPATVRGQPAQGAISILALAGEPQSVADLLPSFADRIGRGNAGWVGPWTVYAIGLLLAAGVALGGWAVARTPRSAVAERGMVTPAARALTLAALAIGLAWALLIPPFQVADETSHTAYVQYLAEAGRLPVERPGVAPFSEEQRELLGALGFARVIGRPLEPVLSTPAEEANLRSAERRELPLGGGNATTASANPPLYYLLQAPVYLATSGGSLLTQLLAMRALSVLLLTGSVLFAFLFVRELLPGSPWTWTAGGLACALQPVLGFVGSGVNPDSLMFLAATAMFFGVARTLRLGLTTRRAVFVGGALAAGLLTKPLFFALAPVAVVGLALAAVRSRSNWLEPCAAAAALVVVPVGVVAVVGAAVFDHPYFAVAAAVASGPAAASSAAGSFSKEASFVLQLFLPRLPFLVDQIPGVPVRDIWIKGFVGVFGWVDYGFGDDAKVRGVRVFLALLALTAVTLLRFRRAVRDRWRLLLCCIVGLLSVPAAVGVVDYQAFQTNGARFQQARYLLPLLALYAGLFALTAKALGPRFGRAGLPVLWVAFSLHTLAAMVLTLNRYYL